MWWYIYKDLEKFLVYEFGHRYGEKRYKKYLKPDGSSSRQAYYFNDELEIISAFAKRYPVFRIQRKASLSDVYVNFAVPDSKLIKKGNSDLVALVVHFHELSLRRSLNNVFNMSVNKNFKFVIVGDEYALCNESNLFLTSGGFKEEYDFSLGKDFLNHLLMLENIFPGAKGIFLDEVNFNGDSYYAPKGYLSNSELKFLIAKVHNKRLRLATNNVKCKPFG